jgi:enoyl-CoA hydratase/carnithine racemase
MILTGEPIPAEKAFDWGLAQWVVPTEDLGSATEALAQRIAALPPAALRLAREALREGAGLTLAEGLRLEARLGGRLAAHSP